MRGYLILSLLIATACQDSPRRRSASGAGAVARVDSTIRGEMQHRFEPPPGWEEITTPSGMTFSQPPGFTVGVNDAAAVCDATTPQADAPVLALEISQRWPLTLAMRRGTLGRIAYANGFTLDTTEISGHGTSPESTLVRRGEGWLLLKSPTALFGATRHPNGCYLVWAARGININADTLGKVLGTVRFVAPDTGK